MTARILSVLITLVLLAAVTAWLMIDADRLKEEIETRLGDALDMEVHIGQPLQFGLFPRPHVVLAEVEVASNGETIGTAQSIRVQPALSALLLGRMRPRELEIRHPEAWITRHSSGVYNVWERDPEPERLQAIRLRALRVHDARLHYLDQPSELEWEIEGCDLVLRHGRHDGGMPEQALASLAAHGQLTCRSLRQEQFTVNDVAVELQGRNGRFALQPITATVFDGRASGRLDVDLSGEAPAYALQQNIAGFDAGIFMSQLGPKQEVDGRMDLDVALSAHGTTWQEVRSSAAGSVSLSAEDVAVHGYDLDDELDDYAATQRFNLIDVGAMFLAGPAGLAATQGYRFAGLLRGSGGTTRIEHMVSEWTVEGGVAQASDVAFSTPKNRIALAGRLDFVAYRFDDLTAAVVDRDGCALVEQSVTGDFDAPDVKTPNVLITVIGPLIDLVRRGMKTVSGSDCEPFYTGSLPHPS